VGELNMLDIGGRIFASILLIPYFGWGIYTLRLRYRYYEELSAKTEMATLAAVGVLYCVELSLFQAFISGMPVYSLFAILGLVVSGTALYGPMVISLCSRVLVDLLMPDDRSKTHEPHYAPAEALERDGDFDGALREYTVIARIFPKEPTALLRIADLHCKAERYRDAAHWFDRALPLIPSAEESLQVANRLSALYQRQLQWPDDARRVLKAYVDRFPEGEFSDSVRERLARLDTHVTDDLHT